MGDVHQGFAGILLKPWGERDRNQSAGAAGAVAAHRRAGHGAGHLILAAGLAGIDRRPAGSVRHHHHARLRAACRGAGGCREVGEGERAFHLLRLRSAVRDAADRVPYRSRQGEPSRHHHGRCRQLAGDPARRQLRQSVRPLWAQLSGHSAGAARVPRYRELADALPDPHAAPAISCRCRTSPR